MNTPESLHRVGVIETTVWQTGGPEPRTKVTVARRYLDRNGEWRVNLPSVTDQSRGFPFLARLAALWINEANTLDLPSEPDSDPAGTVH